MSNTLSKPLHPRGDDRHGVKRAPTGPAHWCASLACVAQCYTARFQATIIDWFPDGSHLDTLGAAVCRSPAKVCWPHGRVAAGSHGSRSGGLASSRRCWRRDPQVAWRCRAQCLASHIGQRACPRVPGETAGPLVSSGSLRFAPVRSFGRIPLSLRNRVSFACQPRRQ